jgi:phosphate transport system substrate-binding protein
MRKRLSLIAVMLMVTAVPAFGATQLIGAGSTFDYPFFSKAFYEYGKRHGDVQVNYQSIGSGGGIQQFTQGTVDFGATDVPMNAVETRAAEAHGGPVLQVPIALGGVSVVYNVSGVGGDLRLDGPLVADIFMGRVTSWDDSRIAKENRGKHLHVPIVVVHRSDGSGTTYVFTDYLAHVSGEWKSKVGTGKSVAWTARSAIGGKGSEGLAGQVNNNPGAIGYVELAYALQNHMTAAQLRNAAGRFVADTKAGVHAAAATKPSVSPTNFSIVNARCADCYPIAGYSWAIVFQHSRDSGKTRALHDVLTWLTGRDAQQIAASLDYVPLPPNVSRAAQKTLQSMR